jgi:hypothetical protein
MKFTHSQLALIQNALRTAAAQYSIDRDTARKANQSRIADQFYKQAQEARELADWIDTQE